MTSLVSRTATRPIYGELPDELRIGCKDRVGILTKSLYGTRYAPLNLSLEYTEVLDPLGFAKCSSSPCTFSHTDTRISAAVHGDDFVSDGSLENLRWMDAAFREPFGLKTGIVRASSGLVTDVRLLNRVVRWTPQGIAWEPDQWHSELVIDQLQLNVGNPTPRVTPCSKEATRRPRGQPDGEEFVCDDCHMLHAFGEARVSEQKRWRCSATSRASCRRTDTNGASFSSSFQPCSLRACVEHVERLAGTCNGRASIHGKRLNVRELSEHGWSQVDGQRWSRVERVATARSAP